MIITATADDSPCSPFGALLVDARDAASVDVQSFSDGDVLAALNELSEVASAVDATLARVIDQADRNDTTIADCGLKVGGWMARHTNRPAGQCRKQASRARVAVQNFSECVRAVGDGLINWDDVELLVAVSNVRNRDQLSSVQAELTEAAQRLRWREWESLVRRLAEEADEDGSYNPNEDANANRLRLNGLPDGTLDVTGRLVGEWALVVEGTIDAIADELFHTYTRDHEIDVDLVIPDRITLRALALAEACRRARAIDLDRTAPARPEAVVVIQHDQSTNGTWITDRCGKKIPEAAIARLLSDADYRALTIDEAGNPLSLGRKQRLITRDQRIALTVRDGGCTFPGCDTPATWCDGHHVIPWTQGGPTDMLNLALLCRHHHGLTHTNGWRMRPSAGDTLFEWVTPTGRTLPSEHRSGVPPSGS